MSNTKSFPAQFVSADDTGHIEAFVSVFGVIDSYNEIVEVGAFAKSLERKLPVGVWMHDWTKPIAKTLEAKEVLPGDESLPDSIREYGGLFVKAQFNLATERGKDAYADIAFGLIDEFSIGYSELKARDEDSGVRHLLELDLHEWSPVVRGANPMTQLVSVKGKTLREELNDTLAALANLRIRLQARQDEREQNGRSLSKGQRLAIEYLIKELRAIAESPGADDARAEMHDGTLNPDNVRALLDIRRKLEAKQR